MNLVSREPTRLAVKALREAFPDESLTTAGVISYQQVEATIGSSRESAQFKSAVRMWRRLVEEESRIVIGCKAGAGFYCADDRDKLQMSVNKARSAVRAAVRSKKIGELVNRLSLSTEEQRRLDHTARTSGAIIAISNTRKPIELPSLV